MQQLFKRILQLYMLPFAEINLPNLVDIVDWALIPDSFCEEIKQQYAVLQTPQIKI